MKTKLLFTGLALLALTTFASAQNTVTGQNQPGRYNRSAAFVDADKNGICDNFENTTPRRNAGRGNGNYVGRGKGNGFGQGRGSANGQGRGPGQGQGQGYGRNFKDENKNGVCDYREVPSEK